MSASEAFHQAQGFGSFDLSIQCEEALEADYGYPEQLSDLVREFFVEEGRGERPGLTQMDQIPW